MTKTVMPRNLLHVIRLRLTLSLLFVAVCVGIWSCENPEGELNPNAFPETRLANLPPNDTIAQYINQGVIPEQTVFWLGDDADGYVIAYHYTWTTFAVDNATPGDTLTVPGRTVTILNLAAIAGTALDTLAIVPDPASGQTRMPGSLFRIYNFMATLDPDDLETRNRIDDSLGTGRVFAVPYPTGTISGDSLVGADPLNNETPTKGVFIFDSPGDQNLHRFLVSAIDNSETIDPTPAVVNFWTLPSPGLTVFISTGPTVSSSPFVLRYPTDKSPGLVFTFGGIDPSTSDRDYSWSVDDTSGWSVWDGGAAATITAIQFEETGSDTHMFFLRGRNRWGVISPVATRQFRASVPPIDSLGWTKKTLVINNCRITSPPSPVWMPPVDSALVNEFYRGVMDSLGKTLGVDYDLYVTSGNAYRFPTRDVLAKYTSILLLSEQELPNSGLGAQTRIDAGKQALLVEYLNIGGKLIFSGSPNIKLMFGLATSTAWDVLGNSVFHILTAVSTPRFPLVQNEGFDFDGGIGKLDYPNVQIDSTKLPPEAAGTLRNIALSYPRGFGQTIFEFDSRSDSTSFENLPVGIRYLAPPPIFPARQTFSVVYFGFPLYYAEKSGVIAALRKAFEDINE